MHYTEAEALIVTKGGYPTGIKDGKITYSSYIGGDDGWGDGSTWFKSCSHNQTPIKVGRYTVLCSGWSGWAWQDRVATPDLGVYLDNVWFGASTGVLVAGNVPNAPPALYDTIFIDWADYAATNTPHLEWAVDTIFKYLKLGKRVEIGCFGGHGRTGTLLACLFVKQEKLSAFQAIKQVRIRYCDRAVESKSQMEQVFEFARQKPKGKHYKKLGVALYQGAVSRQLPLDDTVDPAAIEEDIILNDLGDAEESLTYQPPANPANVEYLTYANIGGVTHVKCKTTGQWLPEKYARLIDSASPYPLEQGVR